MVEAPSQEVNRKKRSRKWVLACVSLALATAGATAMEFMAFLLARKGLLAGPEWRQVVVAVLYWWLFLDLGILAGYGIPNVIEKWAPRGGGV